jgi:hypothetical protein
LREFASSGFLREAAGEHLLPAVGNLYVAGLRRVKVRFVVPGFASPDDLLSRALVPRGPGNALLT